MTNEINNENPIETTDQSTNENGKVIMNRLNKIKNHLKNNKKVYIAVGATFVVTAVTTYLLTSRVKVSQSAVNAAVVNWKPTINQEQTTIVVERRGRPGTVVRHDQSGIIYNSETEAAKALEVAISRISDQINGKTKTVNGNTFTKLVEAEK